MRLISFILLPVSLKYRQALTAICYVNLVDVQHIQILAIELVRIPWERYTSQATGYYEVQVLHHHIDTEAWIIAACFKNFVEVDERLLGAFARM